MQTYRNLFVGLVLAGSLAGCGMGKDSMSGGGMSDASTVQPPVMVGGAPMLATRNIVENASNSADHTTLVAAVKQADLVSVLQGPGPYTVFAPTNDAFDALPAGTVEGLMQDGNEPMLARVLTYHVVPGRLDSAELMRMIEADGGQATLTTVEGDPLIAMMAGDRIEVEDVSGNAVTVTLADVYQSNGVIHVVDGVLLPPM